MQANYRQRIRMRFSKEGPARYISHLDLSRTIERALIRAKVPLAYTQGFNPRPKMQFANALPLGFTSEGEIVDIWLKEIQNPQETLLALSKIMAPGISLSSAEEVDLSSPALQTMTEFSRYAVYLSGDFTSEQIEDRVSILLEKPAIIRVRRDKEYDLRPLIADLLVIDTGEDLTQLTMKLLLEPTRIGRPEDVLKALRIDPLTVRIHRQEIILAKTESDD